MTWRGLTGDEAIRISGISTGMTSITFEIEPGAHCHSSSFGQDYADLNYAKNSCISNPECGAVYEQACTDIEYNVVLRDSEDLSALTTVLVTVTVIREIF